jgi:hypothetical protein
MKKIYDIASFVTHYKQLNVHHWKLKQKTKLRWKIDLRQKFIEEITISSRESGEEMLTILWIRLKEYLY